MKITVYTTTECQFSKQEKEYLNANKLAFEEKNLETNKEFLTEMMAISNNFAGTPVTRVEKDDGSIAVLKGFTKEEFDTTFGFAPVAAPADKTTAPAPTTANDSPVTTPAVPPVSEVPPVVAEAVKPPVDAVSTPPVETPTPAAPTDSVPANDELKSVMDSLQSKVQDVVAANPQVMETPQPVAPPADQTAQPVSPPPPTTDLPKVPEPDFK